MQDRPLRVELTKLDGEIMFQVSNAEAWQLGVEDVHDLAHVLREFLDAVRRERKSAK